jgi:hypothetical protein
MNISGDDLKAKKSEIKNIEKPVEEETAEEETSEESREEAQPKDVKLGEIQLKESSVLVIKKTTYNGNDRIDFRVWLNSAKYKGPTRQGFTLPMNKIDDFVEIVEDMKKKLEKSKK